MNEFVNNREFSTPTAELNCKVHFKTGRRGRTVMKTGPKPPTSKVTPGTIPRITKLMALAIRFDALIKEGKIENMAELADLGNVSRARLSQIMNLLQLAPDIQEEILFLPRTVKGHDAITERQVRGIALELDWGRQHRSWRKLVGRQAFISELL